MKYLRIFSNLPTRAERAKRAMRLFAVICCVVLSGSCCEIQDGDGIVYDKQHHKARSYWQSQIVGRMITGHMVHVPEHWTVYYKHKDCEKCYDIKETEYNECNVGDRFYKITPHCR